WPGGWAGAPAQPEAAGDDASGELTDGPKLEPTDEPMTTCERTSPPAQGRMRRTRGGIGTIPSPGTTVPDGPVIPPAPEHLYDRAPVTTRRRARHRLRPE